MPSHLAAVSVAKAAPLEVRSRPTPQPGPGEILVAVKAVALNPADHLMRDLGLFIPEYPTVVGFDMAGLVLAVGPDVPTAASSGGHGPFFEPGVTRVAAYAAAAWTSCGPDYGIFQECCLVPWQHAAPLPVTGISWNHAATLPVAVQVPLSAWDAMGIPRMGSIVASSPSTSAGDNPDGDVHEDANHKTEVLLIWGASSSVGTMGVQTARLLRDADRSSFAAVYAVAGAANHEYVSSLGADRVFDYKDLGVVDSIVAASRQDKCTIRHCFLAMGDLAACQAVLGAFTGVGMEKAEGHQAKIASAPAIPPDAAEVDGVETMFVRPSWDREERLAQFRYWMGTFLRETWPRGPSDRVRSRGLWGKASQRSTPAWTC